MNEKTHTFIKIASIACIIACVGDFVGMFFLGNFYPGYSQLRNTMSALGTSISPVSNEISIWWIIAGFLFIFFGIAFKKAFIVKTSDVKIASWLIIFYGIGEEIGSGVFKEDAIGTALTKTNIIHNLFGGIGVLSILLLPLFMKKIISRKQMPAFYKMSTVIFTIGVLMLLLFLFRFLNIKTNLFYIYKGLWQRISMLNNYIYLTTIALIMLFQKTYKIDSSKEKI